jgi:hypothetical protein
MENKYEEEEKDTVAKELFSSDTAVATITVEQEKKIEPSVKAKELVEEIKQRLLENKKANDEHRLESDFLM